jgi:hypothetical protein
VNVQEAFKSLFDFELRYFALIRSPIVPTSYSRIFVCIPRGSLHLLPVFFQSFFKKTGQPQIFADFAQFAAKFLICVSLTPLARSCMITQRCLRLRHLEQSRRIGERLLGHGFEPLRHNRRSEFPFLVSRLSSISGKALNPCNSVAGPIFTRGLCGNYCR